MERFRLEETFNRDKSRPIALSLRGMEWRLNGRTYEMGAVALEEVVPLNTLELWEIINETNS